MQSTSMAQKARVLFDGVEIPGLIKLGEVARENASIDVPGFKILRKIQTGVTQLPEVEIEMEVRRDTNTLAFMKQWFTAKEVKDATIIYCDSDGVEFARQLWSGVELRKLVIPASDLASVSFAKVTGMLLPYDITDVA